MSLRYHTPVVCRLLAGNKCCSSTVVGATEPTRKTKSGIRKIQQIYDKCVSESHPAAYHGALQPWVVGRQHINQRPTAGSRWPSELHSEDVGRLKSDYPCIPVPAHVLMCRHAFGRQVDPKGLGSPWTQTTRLSLTRGPLKSKPLY